MPPVNNELRWQAALLGTLFMILLINPVGFVGGGGDDWQYLNAARCWVEQGSCLPNDHWQGRWPIVAPLAAIIAIFGESRLTVGLPSLSYSLGCILLLCWLGNRVAGRPSGYLSALFLLVTPAFAVELLDPTVGAAELFFLLAAACCVVLYTDGRGAWLAFGAGLSLSLAFQVRETAAAAAPLALISAWLFARHDRRIWLAATVGALLPLAVEVLTYWAVAGDPMWRRKLSLAHTQIPSTELSRRVDEHQSPFLNPAYIASWRHEAGIHFHWTVDGLINLVANAKAGLTIAASALLFAIYGRRLDASHRRLVAWSLGAAFYWACVLIYLFAIDPKARMMMVPIALTALALGVLVRNQLAKGSAAIGAASAAAVFGMGFLVTIAQPRVGSSEPTVERWANRYSGQIETSETTRRHLALSKVVGDFADVSSDRPYLVLRLATRCSDWAAREMKGALVVLDRSPMGLVDPSEGSHVNNFCLFRYARLVPPGAIE